MIQKFRKKPAVIEAVQFTGFEDNVQHENLCNFLATNFNFESYDGPILYINTLEGKMRCSPGDYIIKGVKGEFYPCKPDIFAMTYEKVD